MNWCFCVNNYGPCDELALQRMCLDEDVKYMVYGYEICPTTGTPHLQGHMQSNHSSGTYYNTLRSKLRCWWGVTRGRPIQADNYARGFYPGKTPNVVWEFGTIDLGEEHTFTGNPGNAGNPLGNPLGNPGNAGNRLGNPGNAGNPSAKGPTMQERMERNKRLRQETMDSLCNTGEISVMQVRGLKNARMDLREEVRSSCAPAILDGDMDNYWYWGPSGTGKSLEARRRWDAHYYKNCNKWWCGYNGQETVLIEDFDKNHQCLCHHLKIWADRYPFTAEVKQGSTGTIRPARIVVTSNYHPRDIWPDAGDLEPILRRFKIVHFDRNFNFPVVPQPAPEAFADNFNVPDDGHADGGELRIEDLSGPEDECAPTLLYVPPPAVADDSAQECEDDPDTQEESDYDSDTDSELAEYDARPGLLATVRQAINDLYGDDEESDLDEFLDNCSPFEFGYDEPPVEDVIDLTQEE